MNKNHIVLFCHCMLDGCSTLALRKTNLEASETLAIWHNGLLRVEKDKLQEGSFVWHACAMTCSFSPSGNDECLWIIRLNLISFNECLEHANMAFSVSLTFKLMKTAWIPDKKDNEKVFVLQKLWRRENMKRHVSMQNVHHICSFSVSTEQSHWWA